MIYDTSMHSEFNLIHTADPTRRDITESYFDS